MGVIMQDGQMSEWVFLSQTDHAKEISASIHERGITIGQIKTAMQHMNHQGTVSERVGFGGQVWDAMLCVSFDTRRSARLVVLMGDGKKPMIKVFREGDIPRWWIPELIKDFGRALNVF